MQDRYAGDVGDFLKIGLLRQLTETFDADAGLRLGVVWYLAPDEDHNADGRHVSYLDPASAAGRELRPLDPDLYDRLARVVATGRSVAALEAAGVLPPGTETSSEVLSFADVKVGSQARLHHRRGWVERAAAAVADADLVFADPDNGLRRTDHREQRHRTNAVKHTYYDELLAFTEHGQSIVAYHHADRTAKVDVQAQRRMEEAAEETGIEPLAVVRASRGSTRLFLVLAQSEHRAHLEGRMARITAGPWGRELQVIRPRSPSATSP